MEYEMQPVEKIKNRYDIKTSSMTSSIYMFIYFEAFHKKTGKKQPITRINWKYVQIYESLMKH